MITQDVMWWLSAVELPALSALFWMIWRTRAQYHKDNQLIREQLSQRSSEWQYSLANFRIEVAQSYAHNNNVKELEKRLISHLLRIEAKLDTTALKTESLSAKTDKTL